MAMTGLVISGSCKKGNGGGGGGVNTIDIETSPASGSVLAAAPGPTFPLVVTIKSTMPSGGVKIDVSARPDGSATPFYSTSITSTGAVNNFTILNTPSAVVCVVDVTVTAVTNTSVRATASYKFSRK